MLQSCAFTAQCCQKDGRPFLRTYTPPTHVTRHAYSYNIDTFATPARLHLLPITSLSIRRSACTLRRTPHYNLILWEYPPPPRLFLTPIELILAYNAGRLIAALQLQNQQPETNVTVKWFPAHAGELHAGPNRNEEADTKAHALTSRGSPSTHSSEPQRPDAEDEEYSITTYGDVLQWYRTSRRLYPPPHRDLQRSEAATLRQLQVQAIWTPVWAKHVCPEVYTTDICQHCKKARATQRHLLWDCAPPPDNQEAMPTVISSKIISREPGNQRDVVQHVLSILERQRPKAAPPRV
ncbi:hypothetical protein HPB49_008579 [Dermacentor silvarum]|uniref:Uncharacterized protein n=1 Tax=Dermacentor silvarum TaxID=543639 RepID=A0ACB8DXL2_DERSI|nr:hypothetical protein HPB49_008579 [Dermacentor silvarum]